MLTIRSDCTTFRRIHIQTEYAVSYCGRENVTCPAPRGVSTPKLHPSALPRTNSINQPRHLPMLKPSSRLTHTHPAVRKLTRMMVRIAAPALSPVVIGS
ncbi:hypothetical protein FJTKL_06082 [Diaporthe vaccinii]|uniref:Uncharacterized protein n=1 Tax=Diaporthe vaccinii TaxID=105482 RepID=A0ABR4EXD1_9PEZI